MVESYLTQPLIVLLAEDEALLACELEDHLASLGFRVLGPFWSVSDAMKSMASYTPHLAILDVNLSDGEVFPLADILDSKDIPLIFHTGNPDRTELTTRYSRSQMLSKPATPTAIENAIERVRNQLIA